MSNVQCPTSRLVIGHSTLDICLSYGEGGIRTPDRGISPYNGLANRRLQPLGHLSRTAQPHRYPMLMQPLPNELPQAPPSTGGKNGGTPAPSRYTRSPFSGEAHA